jgi:hypothetical protein
MFVGIVLGRAIGDFSSGGGSIYMVDAITQVSREKTGAAKIPMCT